MRLLRAPDPCGCVRWVDPSGSNLVRRLGRQRHDGAHRRYEAVRRPVAVLGCRVPPSSPPLRNETQGTMMTVQMQIRKSGRVRPLKACWRYIRRVASHDTAPGREHPVVSIERCHRFDFSERTPVGTIAGGSSRTALMRDGARRRLRVVGMVRQAPMRWGG